MRARAWREQSPSRGWPSGPQRSPGSRTSVENLDDTIRDIRRTIFDLGASEGESDIQYAVTRVVERATIALKFGRRSGSADRYGRWSARTRLLTPWPC
ncbi:hypothetical protein JCM10369A_42230 [Nocardioides pyridinolyticus]